MHSRAGWEYETIGQGGDFLSDSQGRANRGELVIMRLRCLVSGAEPVELEKDEVADVELVRLLSGIVILLLFALRRSNGVPGFVSSVSKVFRECFGGLRGPLQRV